MHRLVNVINYSIENKEIPDVLTYKEKYLYRCMIADTCNKCQEIRILSSFIDVPLNVNNLCKHHFRNGYPRNGKYDDINVLSTIICGLETDFPMTDEEIIQMYYMLVKDDIEDKKKKE